MAEPESPRYASPSAATLDDVVRIYNTKQSLGLSEQQLSDLAQYLRSL